MILRFKTLSSEYKHFPLPLRRESKERNPEYSSKPRNVQQLQHAEQFWVHHQKRIGLIMKQSYKLGKIRFINSMQHELTKGIEIKTQGHEGLPESSFKVSSRHWFQQEHLDFLNSILLAHSLNPHDFGVYTKL